MVILRPAPMFLLHHTSYQHRVWYVLLYREPRFVAVTIPGWPPGVPHAPRVKVDNYLVAVGVTR